MEPDSGMSTSTCNGTSFAVPSDTRELAAICVRQTRGFETKFQAENGNQSVILTNIAVMEANICMDISCSKDTSFCARGDSMDLLKAICER